MRELVSCFQCRCCCRWPSLCLLASRSPALVSRLSSSLRRLRRRRRGSIPSRNLSPRFHVGRHGGARRAKTTARRLPTEKPPARSLSLACPISPLERATAPSERVKAAAAASTRAPSGSRALPISSQVAARVTLARPAGRQSPGCRSSCGRRRLRCCCYCCCFMAAACLVCGRDQLVVRSWRSSSQLATRERPEIRLSSRMFQRGGGGGGGKLTSEVKEIRAAA